MERKTSMARRWITWGFALCSTSCSWEPVSAPTVDQPPQIEPARIELEISSETTIPGQRVAIAVRIRDAHELAGLHGALRFDPARLVYAGQGIDAPTLTIVNERNLADGRLDILSLNVSGLPARSAQFVFEVRRAGYLGGLRFEPIEAVSKDVEVVVVTAAPVVHLAPDLLVANARRLSLDDWSRLLYADELSGEIPNTPGQYVLNLRYGDATLNGVITGLDAAVTANAAVGNNQIIAGTDSPNRDLVIAANVRPSNAPGLGDVGDVLPPGVEADGTRRVSGLDAVAIANEGVGIDQAVVGEFIPGRGPRPTDRVVVSGNITLDRTFTNDTIYELQGMVNVVGGVTLTIEAGTIIEGDEATRGLLVVRRGADIIARGTPLEPIVFTCAAEIRQPGCWGGVVVNGFALLNNGEGTSGTPSPQDAPIVSVASDIGCPEKAGSGGSGLYGGCISQDASGILRFVRIEYAGAAVVGGQPVAGLSLLGAGSGTVVDSVQVHASLGDGILLSGGAVDLRSIVLTANAGSSLHWDDGYGGNDDSPAGAPGGRLQFVIIQQADGAGPALRGSNAPNQADWNAGPRSRPEIYHLTIVGPAAGSGAGLLLEHGTGAIIRNAIVLRAGAVGLDIQDDATCAVAGSTLAVESSIFFGSPADFALDADCLDEGAFALDAARQNRVIDPQILSPLSSVTPDFRLLAGSPALSGFAMPPANGFFDLTAFHVGAVPAADATRSNIPWFSGWTRGWGVVP